MRDKNHSILAVVFSTLAMIHYACKYRDTAESYYLFILGFCVALVLFTLHNYREFCKMEKANMQKAIQMPTAKKRRKKKRKHLLWGKKKRPEIVQYNKYQAQYEAMWEELNK